MEDILDTKENDTMEEEERQVWAWYLPLVPCTCLNTCIHTRLPAVVMFVTGSLVRNLCVFAQKYWSRQPGYLNHIYTLYTDRENLRTKYLIYYHYTESQQTIPFILIMKLFRAILITNKRCLCVVLHRNTVKSLIIFFNPFHLLCTFYSNVESFCLSSK